MTSISGLPAVLLYLVTAGRLIGMYILVYTLATAHNGFAWGRARMRL